MTTPVERQIDRLKRLQDDRRILDAHYQRLAEIMIPRKADFTVTRASGERRMENVFDSTPMIAARGLASAVDGMIKPKTSRWFHLRADDYELNDAEEVQLWLADVEDRMYSAIYDSRARFIHATGETDLDLVIFGTGVLFVGESTKLDHLMFKNHHLKNSYIVRNGDGHVDTIFITAEMTAGQAAQRFGENALGETARKLLADGKPEHKVEYVQIVEPKDESVFGQRGVRGMLFRSTWVETKSKAKVHEGGFHEFPFVIPVWDSASNEDYGRSPGMVALPDSNTLMAQSRTLLKAGQKIVDPPLTIASDSVIGAVRTWPGGNTYFDIDSAKSLGRVPIAPLTTGANIPLGREMQNDTREQIGMAFFRHVLQLPIDRPEMTATEVLERKQEYIHTLGPVFGKLESDYIGPMVDRVFSIMMRAGAFMDPPDVLRGRGVSFVYMSPIERARKQIEAAAVSRTAEIINPYAAVDISIMDNYDGDEIAKGVAEANGMPIKWMRPDEQVDMIRQQRAEQAQAQQAAEDAERTADAVSKLANTSLVSQAAQGES